MIPILLFDHKPCFSCMESCPRSVYWSRAWFHVEGSESFFVCQVFLLHFWCSFRSRPRFPGTRPAVKLYKTSTGCWEQAETTNAIDKRCHAKLVSFDFRLNHNQDNDKCHHEEVDSTPSLTNLSTPWLNNTMTNLPPNMSLWSGFGDRSISMRNAPKQWPIHVCLVWHYDGDDDIQGDTGGLI